MRFASVLILLFCWSLLTRAQLPDSCRLQFGTNLSGPADWGSEWPFVNIMKYSRTWITANNAWINGGENAWDTQVLEHIPLDEQGYPLELPVEGIPGTEAPQIVRTVWANTAALPAGEYVLLYEGTGEVDLWGDASIVSQSPGRVVAEVTPGQDNIIALELLSSQEGDHIRNIRFLLPGTEETYEQNPWTAAWLEKLAPFQRLRFMDWGYTNGSRLEQWEDRPKVDDYTYTIDGVPYEWWIELCNKRQSDAWVCIPHAADDNYIRQMARLFRDELDPELTIYVEYSNEIWNWIFEQTHYCDENGDQDVPWPERIVPFVQNALDIWTEEFEGEMDRLVRVVGVQGAWQDVSNRIVFNMEEGRYDAFAPAAYFGFTGEGIAALEALGADATGADVLQWAQQGLRNQSFDWLKSQHESIAQELDIPMLYYEGGQHLTPEPFGSEQPYNPALVEAQSMPGMYGLYQEWYDSLRTLATGAEPALLMNFSFIGPTSGRYGSWGLLTSQFHQDAPYGDAPKYRAVLDNIYNCETAVSTKEPQSPASPITLYPNPAQGEFHLRLPPGEYTIRIYDVFGRMLNQQTAYQPDNAIPFSGAPGVYLVTVHHRDGAFLTALPLQVQ